MSLSLFGIKNNWHKNGIWWFTKILNRAVGEERYDALRVQRRIWGMRFYYARQQCLYEMFVDHPDLANWVFYLDCSILHIQHQQPNKSLQFNADQFLFKQKIDRQIAKKIFIFIILIY